MHEDEETLEDNLDRLLSVHSALQGMLADYDQRLMQVLSRHEQDFLSAYKSHMAKVERELVYLKAKAREQEKTLAEDKKIKKMQDRLNWF